MVLFLMSNRYILLVLRKCQDTLYIYCVYIHRFACTRERGGFFILCWLTVVSKSLIEGWSISEAKLGSVCMYAEWEIIVHMYEGKQLAGFIHYQSQHMYVEWMNEWKRESCIHWTRHICYKKYSTEKTPLNDSKYFTIIKDSNIYVCPVHYDEFFVNLDFVLIYY